MHPPPSPHHPHPAVAVHSSQSAADAQLAPPPPHSLDSQLQSEHDPVSGPEALPAAHAPVSPHHPHG